MAATNYTGPVATGTMTAQPTTTAPMPAPKPAAKPKGKAKLSKAEKARAAWAKRTVTPGSGLTNAQASSMAQAAMNVKYGPQQQALAQAGRNVNQWFPAYQQELTNLNNAQQQRYSAVVQQIAQQAQQAQTAQAQSNQSLAAQLQQDAAGRGASYSGAPSVQSQAASNGQQDLANAFAAAIAAQGAAYSGYTSQQQGVAGAARLNAEQTLQGQRGQLAGQRAADRVATMGQIRSDEQKNVLEQAAFNMRAQTEADTVKTQRQRIKVQRQNSKRTSATQRANNAATNATSRANTQTRAQAQQQAARQKAQAQQQKHVQDVRDKSGAAMGRLSEVNSRWHTYFTSKVTETKMVNGKKTTVTRKPTDDEIRQRLIHEGFNATEIHLARLLKNNRLWTPADVQLAHQLGIRVPRHLIQPDYSPAPATGAPLAPGSNGQSRPT